MNTEQIIKNNIPLVKSIVSSFDPNNKELRDQLFSAGLCGLWKAVQDYDNETYGTQLTTIAVNRIRWEIINTLKELDSGMIPFSCIKEPFVVAYYPSPPLWEIEPTYLTPMEKKLIALKLARYTFQEMANTLNTNIMAAYRMYYKAIDKIKRTNGEQKEKNININ